jgi:hypothetical protein
MKDVHQSANKSAPTHDMAMARDCLAIIDSNAEKFAFQFISDGADRRRSNIRFLTLEEAWAVIETLNTPVKGLGVFVLPNTPQPRLLIAYAENAEQINRASAALQAGGAKVDMCVNDGDRAWLCYACSDIPSDQLPALQARLSAKLGTTVTDVSWVRLPGTLNLEDPAAPRLVTLVRNGASTGWKVADLFDKLDKLELSSNKRSGTALDQVTQFLSRVVPWPENPNDDGASGHVNIHWTMRKDGEVFWPGKPTRTVAGFLKLVRWVLGQPDPGNIYFCTSLQRECARNAKGRPKAIRSAENALALKAIWLDIDVKSSPKGYATIEEALKAIDKFKDHYKLPAPTYIIASGNGLHVYWISTRALSVDEWRPFAEGLKAAALAFELRCDTQCTVDCARILRVPGTFNFKTKIPKPVYIGFDEGKELDFTVDLKQLPDLAPAKKAKPDQDRGQDSPLLVDFGPVKAGCGWLHGVHTTRGKDQSEVLWRDALRVSGFLKDGHKLRHEFSEEHEGYNFAETEKKFDEVFKAKKGKDLGWPQCRTIHGHHDNPSIISPCASCPRLELDKSPLNLALDADAGVKLEDFYAYMPTHDYIFAPSREHWPAASVNARIAPIETGEKDEDGEDETIPASRWLDQNQPVEMMTWVPGMPMIIADRLIAEGGWIERKGVSCFNLYRPPTIELGDASKAGPWIELVHKIYPDDAEHIIKWFAQRCRYPHVKINHGLLLGGVPGIGKDTIIEPVKRAIGAWNFKEIAAKNVFDSFNPWRRSVILRISEVKDMGDVTRFEFYEGTKTLMAAPPDVLECNEKHIKQHYIMNCTGVLITTNHLTDGIYLPADDRRHHVAWSKCVPTDFAPGYFNEIWKWYDEGGDRHVAAYLATLDISDFDPKATPLKTAAFWSIVNANRSSEEGDLQDALDKLGNPDAVTIDQLKEAIGYDSDKESLWQWLEGRRNRKAVNHRLAACGYPAVNNPDADDGYWRIGGRRRVVYAKSTLSPREQLKAAGALQRGAAEAEAARAAKAKKAARAAKARAAKAQAAEEAEEVDKDLISAFERRSAEAVDEGKSTGFRVVGECEETTVCIACGKPGNVQRLAPIGRPGAKSETLHWGCAPEWFAKGL